MVVFMKHSELPQKSADETSKSKSNLLQNTAAAVGLLKEWLSVSESQICSTEVLSEQLPKINSLLETSMNSISSRFSAVSTNLKTISNSIETLESSTQNEDKQALEQAKEALKKTNQDINQIIMDMQFQDRVSQNIVITINVMKAVVDHIEESIETTMPDITRQERRKLLDVEFAKQILDQFRLGELQNSFVQHLLDHDYIKSPDEVGYEFKAEKSVDDDNDVDLF
jgi:hypothetical protein